MVFLGAMFFPLVLYIYKVGGKLFWLRWFIQLGAFWPKKMHFLTIFPFSAKITISLKRSLRPQKLTKCANFLHDECRDHEEYFIFFALYFVDPQSITKMAMKNIHFRRILLCWCTYTVLYCTVLYCTVLYCTVQCGIVLYCTVLYRTVQYSTVQYSRLQYTTV